MASDSGRHGIGSASDGRHLDQSAGAGRRAPYQPPMMIKGPALSDIAAIAIATSGVPSDTA
jgi:hypothetical protein